MSDIIAGSPSSFVRGDVFLDSGIWNAPLEPVNMNHFVPKHELSTEDDEEPTFYSLYFYELS